MPTAAASDRSQSINDIEDTDGEDVDFPSNASAKPGRKKNPNSQAARRDQNRIAQREFRLRKQQRIRDLEAKVEILSGGKDEAMSEMRNIVKDLMEENQTLRNLIRSLSAFIGEGAGGLLPKLGWNMSDFNSFINKSETDTAWEGYQRRKKEAMSGASKSSTTLKRPSEESTGSQAKRTRVASDVSTQDKPFLMPSESLYPSPSPPSFPSYSDMMRNGNTASSSQLFYPSSGNPSGSFSQPTSPDMGYPYVPPLNVPQNTSSPLPFATPSSQQSPSATTPATASTQPVRPSQDDDNDEDDDPNKSEAYKLIHYHLDNYKRNTSYCLPSSLRPTLVQRTVPHESVIDRILHPELRDRMILMRGHFDLVDCLLDYRSAITIHGDDVLNHTNWELGEKWLRKYGFLVDQPTLDVCNRWRAERNEPELQLSDIAPPENGSK